MFSSPATAVHIKVRDISAMYLCAVDHACFSISLKVYRARLRSFGYFPVQVPQPTTIRVQYATAVNNVGVKHTDELEI